MFLRGIQLLVLPLLAAPLLASASSVAAGNHTPQRPTPKRVSIFIVAGQSNAIGFGTDAADLPVEFSAPLPQVRFWYDIGNDESVSDPNAPRRTSGGEFVPLAPVADPTGEIFGGAAAGFGPEIGIGHALASSVNEEVAVLKFCFGATGLTFHWNPALEGGLYSQLLDTIDEMKVRLLSQQRVGRVRGVFWVHGENDSTNWQTALEYGTNLRNFALALRNDLHDAQLPVIVSRLNIFLATAPVGNFDFVDVVRYGQQEAVNSLGMAGLVNTDDLELQPHPLHFSSNGQLALGERMALAWHLVVDPPLGVSH